MYLHFDRIRDFFEIQFSRRASKNCDLFAKLLLLLVSFPPLLYRLHFVTEYIALTVLDSS